MANFRTLDLNLLRVLNALLETQSTVKTGQAVGLSQPAVSAALSRLRTSLGDELFFRRGQGLEPTEYALTLKEPLREALEGLDALLNTGEQFDPTSSTASFRISGSDFFAELLMPRLAERLQTLAPRMRVHLVDLVPDSYVDTLERYEVDFALLPETTLPDWIHSRTLFSSTFLVIARRNHPRLARAGVTPGETIPLDLFCDLGHVLFSPEGKPRALGDTALDRVGRQRRVVMSLPVFSGVYRAVSGSDLIALLPASLATHVAEDTGLEIYRAPIPIPDARITMIWHRRFSATPAHVWMRDQVAELLQPLDSQKQATLTPARTGA